MKRLRCQVRGFTLLELILAMTMVVMLMSMLYGAMHTAYKARESCNRAVRTVREVTLAANLVMRDLESALQSTDPNTLLTAQTDSSGTTGTTGAPLSGGIVGLSSQGALGSGSQDPAYEGAWTLYGYLVGAFVGTNNGPDGTYLSFYSVGDEGPVVDLTMGSEGDEIPPLYHVPFSEGVKQVTLSLSVDHNGNPALIRQVVSNLLAPEPVMEEQILCRNVVSCGFYFWDGLTWLEEWDSTLTNNNLPLAVRMELVVEDLNAGPNDRGTYYIKRTIPLVCSTLLESGYNPETGEIEDYSTTTSTTTGG
jgi:prepilin-type N-terminal cleavage/methylation domain-containing protein